MREGTKRKREREKRERKRRGGEIGRSRKGRTMCGSKEEEE